MIKQVKQAQTGEVILARAGWCKSFLCHFKGLMLRPRLDEDEGLIFVTGGESVVATTIHMLFMLMPIAVIWLDKDLVVVDAKYAKPWRLAYAPQKPAQYFIEAHPTLLERVKIGDRLIFD